MPPAVPPILFSHQRFTPMLKHCLTLSLFVFAASAGAVLFLMPWPVAALCVIALAITVQALQAVRDAEIEAALAAEGDAR